MVGLQSENQIKMEARMKLRSIIAMAMSAAALISCSEWTEPESITIKVASMEEDAPEVYAQYCQKIRDYKASDHKMVYVTFDNQQKTSDQSYNLTSLPDSVDVVELSNPEDIDGNLTCQMEKLRCEKAFRFAVELSYDDVKTVYEDSVLVLYNAYQAERDTVKAHGGDPDTVTEPVYPVMADMFQAELDKVFGYVDAYKLDIVRVKYSDLKFKYHLTLDEYNTYVANQTAVFDAIQKELSTREGVSMFLNTNAQYIVSEDIINAAEFVILPTESLFGTSELDMMAVRTVKQYPDAKLLYAVSSASSDFSEGWFNNKTVEQIPIASLWMNEHADFNKSGLVIFNIRRTFYDTNRNVYSKLRNAIKVMNPNS